MIGLQDLSYLAPRGAVRSSAVVDTDVRRMPLSGAYGFILCGFGLLMGLDEPDAGWICLSRQHDEWDGATQLRNITSCDINVCDKGL